MLFRSVEFGLEHIQSIGIDRIHGHVRELTRQVLDGLAALRHGNGSPVVRLYGPSLMERRGGVVTFNFYDAGGRAIDHRQVEERAGHAGIALRTGCFCNPGGGEVAMGLTGTELASCFRHPAHQTHLSLDDFRLCVDGKSTGAVRVSLGLASNAADVGRFLA